MSLPRRSVPSPSPLRELELSASADSVSQEIRDDAQLIRSQVDRCRAILDQMSGAPTNPWRTALETLTPDRVVESGDGYVCHGRSRLA